VVDVGTGESKAFTFEGEGRRFDYGVIAWASKRLESACPCDLLVVDEIGPLELIYGRGWRNALDVVGSGDWSLAVVAIRPRLVHALLRELAERIPAPSEPPSIVAPHELGDIELRTFDANRTGALP
jgi:nucleoside-triphosphatase THEP1